jgi:hypothetical protein
MEKLWGDTMKSGEENGGWFFYEPKANIVHLNRASEGRHITLGHGSQYAPRIAAMPEIGPETRDQFRQFAAEGRSVRMIAFFHTHPNYAGGGSAGDNPSGADMQFQYDYGNPLGIIRNGSGYAFFSNGRKFYPNDPKANECIK